MLVEGKVISSGQIFSKKAVNVGIATIKGSERGAIRLTTIVATEGDVVGITLNNIPLQDDCTG